jgi:hypothetical protein
MARTLKTHWKEEADEVTLCGLDPGGIRISSRVAEVDCLRCQKAIPPVTLSRWHILSGTEPARPPAQPRRRKKPKVEPEPETEPEIEPEIEDEIEDELDEITQIHAEWRTHLHWMMALTCLVLFGLLVAAILGLRFVLLHFAH